MIDVHILVGPWVRIDWFEQCVESLREDVEAGAVNVRVVRGVDGHVGKGRFAALSAAKLPWVSYVDPDDFVVPGAFSVLAAEIEKLESQGEPFCGVYPNEQIVNERGDSLGLWKNGTERWSPDSPEKVWAIHNGAVFRKSTVDRFLPELKNWPLRSEYVLRGMVGTAAPWVKIEKTLYCWRQHTGNVSKTGREWNLSAQAFLRDFFLRQCLDSESTN